MPSAGPPRDPTSNARQRALQARVSRAVLAGRSLDQIAADLEASANVEEDERAALWLYARAELQRLAGGSGPPEREGSRLTVVR